MPATATPLSTEGEKELASQFAVGLECTPAAQSLSELSEEDLLAIDLAYEQKKASGALDRARQHRAVEDQVQMLRCRGGL